MAKPGPSSMRALHLAHEVARGVEGEIVGPQQQQRQRIAIERRDDRVEFLHHVAGTAMRPAVAGSVSPRQSRRSMAPLAMLSRAAAR